MKQNVTVVLLLVMTVALVVVSSTAASKVVGDARRCYAGQCQWITARKSRSGNRAYYFACKRAYARTTSIVKGVAKDRDCDAKSTI